jgi:type II secretory pathway pseudopilin PulG
MRRYYRYNQKRAGFVLAELLVALMVTGVILSAVASLAFALGAANRSTNKLSEHQGALRYASLRISELIKYSSLAFTIPTNGIALWTGDDNANGLINASELVYIESDGSGESLRLLEFPGQSQTVTIANIETGTARSTLIADTDERYVTLLDQCQNVQFTLDASGRFITILFDLTENDITSNYQICGTLLCSADHLLDGSGEPVSGDDD